MYVTFLDASKTFDILNYGPLFDKLIAKRVPLFIIKQLFYTPEDVCSMGQFNFTTFLAGNSVTQGGVGGYFPYFVKHVYG